MQSDGEREPEQLLSEAREGNTTALAKLLEHYRNYVALLARLQIDRRLQSKMDDSDLVQETLYQASRDFQNFRGTTEAQWMQWLRSIMACVAANLIRRYVSTQRRDVRLERQLERELDRSSCAIEQALAAPDSSPSQKAARRETAKRLSDALADLAAEQREVIILHHLEGMTMADVARRMGRSASGVQKLWARAIARLRHRLKEDV